MPGLFQPNLFQNPLLFQVTAPAPGTFRALADVYLPDGRYIEAGTTFTATPAWIPSLGVDPIDDIGIQAFWDAGPACSADADSGRALFGNWAGRRTGVPVGPPVIYWTRAQGYSDSDRVFILTGAGASLGVKNAP